VAGAQAANTLKLPTAAVRRRKLRRDKLVIMVSLVQNTLRKKIR
jgi:hypothetical protein